MSSEPAAGGAPGDDQVSDRFDRSTDYRIRRAPDLLTVTPGAQVRYSCQYRHGQPPTSIGGASNYRDGVRWYKFRARALLEETRSEDPNWAVPIEKGPTGEFHWDCTWNEPPGRYVVGSEISDGRESRFCFLPQYVEAAGLVVGGSLESLLKQGVGPSAAEAEVQVARQITTLEAIEKRFPIKSPADKERHDETMAKWRKTKDRLRGLLGPTDGKPRISVSAMHLETTTQARRPLLLFLCHVDDNLVGRSQRKRPRWVLVDWTDATDTRFHGTYEGDGDTHDEAIASALRAWDWDNRYPAGLVTYELPARDFGQAHRREMRTDGKTLGDEIKGVFEWIAVGGLVVAGALLLFTPVPALAAGALGTSLLSSTAAAGISIGQRWRAGIFDWRQDAFDGLTIVSNLFAGASAWRVGARVLLKGKSGETVTRILIGAQIGNDLVQGVLVAEESLNEWTELTKREDLLPEERSRRLLALVRNLATTGLLTYVSLRASAREVENLNKKPHHVPNEGAARATGEKLADWTDAKATVDTTKAPAAEGHTKEEVHKTTVETGHVQHPKKVGSSESTFAKKYPEDRSKWKERRLADDEIYFEDHGGYTFGAKCRNGTLTMSVFPKNSRTGERSPHIWPKKMYPLTYSHFEQVGNPVQRLEGQWVDDNYRAAKKKYDELIAYGLTPDEAAEDAVKHAVTYKYHQRQGFTKVVQAKHYRGFSTFKFVRESE